MNFLHQQFPLEAVKFGFEFLPDWCGEISDHWDLHHEDDGIVWAEYSNGKGTCIIVLGDYICRTHDGRVFILPEAVFNDLFKPLPKGTVFVNVDEGGGGFA